MSEFVGPAAPRASGDCEHEEDHDDWQEGDDGEEGEAVKLDVAVNAVRVGIEGEERLHDRDDDHGDGEDDEDVQAFEE